MQVDAKKVFVFALLGVLVAGFIFGSGCTLAADTIEADEIVIDADEPEAKDDGGSKDAGHWLKVFVEDLVGEDGWNFFIAFLLVGFVATIAGFSFFSATLFKSSEPKTQWIISAIFGIIIGLITAVYTMMNDIDIMNAFGQFAYIAMAVGVLIFLFFFLKKNRDGARFTSSKFIGLGAFAAILGLLLGVTWLIIIGGIVLVIGVIIVLWPTRLGGARGAKKELKLVKKANKALDAIYKKIEEFEDFLQTGEAKTVYLDWKAGRKKTFKEYKDDLDKALSNFSKMMRILMRTGRLEYKQAKSKLKEDAEDDEEEE